MNDTLDTPDAGEPSVRMSIGRVYGDHAEWAQLVATLMTRLYPAPLDHPTVRHSAASVGHRLTAVFEDREKLRAQLAVANTDLANTCKALNEALADARHLKDTAAARLREVNALTDVRNRQNREIAERDKQIKEVLTACVSHRADLDEANAALKQAQAKLEHDRTSAEAGARLANETFCHLNTQLAETRRALAESEQVCRELRCLLDKRGTPRDSRGVNLFDALMNRNRALGRDLRGATAERDALRAERGKFREWLGDDRTFHRIVTSERSEIWKWRGPADSTSPAEQANPVPTPGDPAGAGPAGPTPAPGSTVNMTGATIDVTIYLAEEDDGQPD